MQRNTRSYKENTAKKTFKNFFKSPFRKFMMLALMLVASSSCSSVFGINIFELFSKDDTQVTKTQDKNKVTKNKKTEKKKNTNKVGKSPIEKGGPGFMLPLLAIFLLNSLTYIRKRLDLWDAEVGLDEINRIWHRLESIPTKKTKNVKDPKEEALKIMIEEIKRMQRAEQNKNILVKLVSKVFEKMPNIKNPEHKKIAIELTMDLFENLDEIDSYPKLHNEIKSMENKYTLEEFKLESGVNGLSRSSDISTKVGFTGTIYGFLFEVIPAFGKANKELFQAGMETAGYTTFTGLVVSLLSTLMYYSLDKRLEIIDFEYQHSRDRLETFVAKLLENQ